jgi:nucleotide-binding universal stress UspA family protein
MFEKILFPTDFSSHARAELECLSGFPDITEVVLLHIVRKYPIPLGGAMIEALVTRTMQGYLDEARRTIGILRPGITVRLEMVSSPDIAGSILDTAVKYGADLIVISGYVKSFKAGVLLGRVPATVLCRVSHTNVLVMPNRLIDAMDMEGYTRFCTRTFSRILCPTDFSDLSIRAIIRAGTMEDVQEILLLHVLPEGAGEQDRATALVRLTEIRYRLEDGGAAVQTILEEGEPAKRIARVAGAEKVSLIWMSTSNRGCLAEFISGSLVHDVVMNGRHPALILRSA